MGVQITVKGNILKALGRHMKDMPVLFNELGLRMSDLARKNIVSGVEPTGVAMKPLSHLSRGMKTGHGILRENSFLYKSIAYDSSGKHATIGAGGPSAPYAKTHQLGMTIRAKKRLMLIPVRKEAKSVLGGGGKKAYEGSIRKVPGLFWIKTKRCVLLCKAMKGSKTKGKRIDIWAIGVPFVRIPRRQFLFADGMLDNPRYKHAIEMSLNEWYKTVEKDA